MEFKPFFSELNGLFIEVFGIIVSIFKNTICALILRMINQLQNFQVADRGLYIFWKIPLLPGEKELSADVIWGKKFEKRKRKRGKM
jgi:hypothetical protein